MTDVCRSVLILGASSAIARAAARRYAALGRSVILAARDPEPVAADAADLMVRYGVAAEVRQLDILEVASHRGFLDGLPELPDTVVCLVGLLGSQTAAEADPALAELVWRTNFTAPAAFLGEVANRMDQRGSGTIIGVSSVAGERGRASNYVYGSAKAGFTAFLSGLRNRLARRGVHVATIKPGFVRTRMTEGLKLPGPLTAEPDEVARALVAAETNRSNVVYVRPIWRLIMTVIGAIPEPIFKTLRL
jgi:NAD(P)-dependent dehydrogenase (short-subunit alcohol dehydrogenase family)